ncbi:Cell cycle checkpoint control protein RAD9A [Anthophora quadrimaculata]
MKCVVPGANVKILAKAIHALAKIGDEMFIEPQKDTISFRTVNMANSAYADITFFQSYFSYYIYGDLQENDALKCKISMRSAMTVFKAPNLIDKQVETCHIRLEPNASEILFILKYKNSITKTHLLPILDCEILQTVYDKDCASNKLSSQPRVLADALQNFHQHLIEITLEVSEQKLLLRNYLDDASGLSNTTRTLLALGKGEFDRYDIGSETSITFCMKEFKSILSFAETIGALFNIYFEAAGRPVIFALKNPSFEVNLVLSTLSSDADSQTDTTLISKLERSVKRRTGNKRVSRKTNNKSTSRIQNKSTKLNTARGNATSKNTHSCSIEENNTENQNISKKRTNSLINIFNTSIKDNENVHKATSSSGKCNTQQKFQKCSMSNYDTNEKSSKTPTEGKRLVNTIFSTITKRKSSNEESNGSSEAEDAVPNSPPPPAKKARLIFQKCFQKTFDPRTLPGYDIILAEDSDGCCSE